MQCDGSEVANCTTSNAANKCLCDGCSQGYQPSGDKKSCTLCESVSNCATMNADICQGCDTCAAGYSRSADGKACSQASLGKDGTQMGLGRELVLAPLMLGIRA